jgi:superfamily II DNA or RNA helicase
MPKKVTTEDFIKKAKEVHGNKYDYSKTVYVKNSQEVVIICPIHGEFPQTPANHTNKVSKSGCKDCGKISRQNKRKLGVEEFIKRAKEVHGDRYDYSKVVYVSNKHEIDIICSEHGIFPQIPGSHLRGGGCPGCAGNKKKTTEQFIEEAKLIHGERYGYLNSNVINSSSNVKITCFEHGEFEQTPESHLLGSNCPKCAGNKKKTTEQFIEEAKVIHGDKYDYSKVVYVGNKKEVTIICPIHGAFDVRASHHTHSMVGCARCAGRGFSKMSYEKAKEWVSKRSPKISKKEEWIDFSKEQDFPEDLPADPRSYYKEDWKCWPDFLGSYNRWTIKTLTHYLEQIKPCLYIAPISVLVTIIEANGLDRYLSLQSIKQLQETKPASKEREDTVKGILGEILEGNEKESEGEEIHDGSFDKEEDEELTDDEFLDILNTEEEGEEDLPEVDLIEKTLDALDTDVITSSLDDERIEFIISNMVNDIWYKVLNEDIEFESLSKKTYKNELPKKIVQDFLEEHKEVINFPMPKEWNYSKEPYLSQKLYAYRVWKRRRYGNFNGTGGGKTIGGALAARCAGAKNVLIITFDSTVGYAQKDEKTRGWIKELENAFPDKLKYYTKFDKNVKLESGYYNYLILNYETFQQKGSANYVIDLLDRNTFDAVILDEVHCVKQRHASTISKRRDLIVALCNRAVKIKPDCCIMPMSATPVVNNLVEPKSIVEIIEQVQLDDVSTKPTVSNCFELHRRLTNCGIRYRNDKTNILKNKKHTLIEIDGSDLLEKAKSLKKGDVLAREKLVLPLKLDAIKDLINSRKGKTILYTHYVGDGIDKMIKDYCTDLGYSVAVYTGNNVDGRSNDLADFIAGKYDLLIGSQPMGTGVDGLQKVSDTMIYLSLPWTKAATDQTDGRINRAHPKFKEVEIFVPLVSIAGKYNWDHKRYNTVTYKATIANAVVDGIIPDKLIPPAKDLISKAEDATDEWIERLNTEGPIMYERPELDIDLFPEAEDKEEWKKRVESELSDFNRKGKTTRSENMNKKFSEDPQSWYRYHALRKSRMEEWSEIPYEYIATKINSDDDVIADFGCGENLFRKCESVKNNKVYSFDHVAIDESVIACDMKNTGLDDNSVDIAVFSLSLWGTNYLDYMKEAHRILTRRGALYIAEPLSVCEDGKMDDLIDKIQKIGFGLLGGIEKRNKFVYITFIKK